MINNTQSSTNVASLVNTNTVSTLKSIKNPKSFGDQVTQVSTKKQISANTTVLSNLYKEKANLIQEEIRLDVEHQKKLLKLQAQKEAGTIPTSFPDPEEPTPEEIAAMKVEYINFFKDKPPFTGDGYDRFIEYQRPKLPIVTTKKVVKAWIILPADGPDPSPENDYFNRSDKLPSSVITYSTIEEGDDESLDRSNQMAVNQGRRKAYFRPNFLDIVTDYDEIEMKKLYKITLILVQAYWDTKNGTLKAEFLK